MAPPRTPGRTGPGRPGPGRSDPALRATLPADDDLALRASGVDSVDAVGVVARLLPTDGREEE